MISPFPWLQSAADKLSAQVHNPPQALCLVGARGLGQELLADAFASELLQTRDPDNHPDMLRVAPESGKTLGIDRIREIHDFCLIPPTLATRKIVRMIQPESMTLPAQQAFLKTLEEPVIQTSFILSTAVPDSLLPTLRSRCQLMPLSSVTYQQAKPWLDSQQIQVSPETYLLSDGGPLLVGTPEFASREQAYLLLTDPSKSSMNLRQSHPLDVLTGFYYALMHQKKFELLDQCIALRKQYSQNPHLNWDMQLNTFLIKAGAYAG